MQIMRVWATTTQNSRKWPNVDDGQIKKKKCVVLGKENAGTDKWRKKRRVEVPTVVR